MPTVVGTIEVNWVVFQRSFYRRGRVLLMPSVDQSSLSPPVVVLFIFVLLYLYVGFISNGRCSSVDSRAVQGSHELLDKALSSGRGSRYIPVSLIPLAACISSRFEPPNSSRVKPIFCWECYGFTYDNNMPVRPLKYMKRQSQPDRGGLIYNCRL